MLFVYYEKLIIKWVGVVSHTSYPYILWEKNNIKFCYKNRKKKQEKETISNLFLKKIRIPTSKVMGQTSCH